MISKEVLKEIILSNEKYIQEITGLVSRKQIFLPKAPGKVVDLYGVRRSGKTYCLYEIFKENPNRTLFLDFEDERLKGFEIEDFQKIKLAFLELKPSLINQEITFILDEVQNIEGWEKYARRISEREKIRVFVSGSSSKMSPQELHTSLRGRSWGIKILPFSFSEYLKIKGLNPDDKNLVYSDQAALIKNCFMFYLKWGGFPEVCFSDSEIEKEKILKEYLEAIFFKDLVERYKISNIPLIDTLRDKLFESSGLKFSLNAFYKQYKSLFPFSKDSLHIYYQYFLQSLIVYEVRLFSPSSYKRRRNPAKIFLVDPGIARKTTSDDLGRRLENVVFAELERRDYDSYYFENQNECDFIARKTNQDPLAIQVTWELNSQNKEREINGLIEACKHLGLNEGTLLTFDEKEDLVIEKIKIKIEPTWKWIIAAA